jgi:hypothetical protein
MTIGEINNHLTGRANLTLCFVHFPPNYSKMDKAELEIEYNLPQTFATLFCIHPSIEVASV